MLLGICNDIPPYWTAPISAPFSSHFEGAVSRKGQVVDLLPSCPSAVPLQDGKPRRNSHPVQLGFWSGRKPSGRTTMNDFLRFIAHLLEKIPNTFWAVLFGSFISLLSSIIANRANLRRLRLQLQNDRELKNWEREMTFRKDAYTAAAGAIAVSIGALSKFSELSFSPKEVSEAYLEQMPALAKVNLVAGEDTIRALAEFGGGFTGAFLRLVQERMVLSNLQEQIASRVALANSGIDAARLAATNQEIRQMTSDFSARRFLFVKQCFAENKNVNQLLIPLLVAARMELELSISKERYAEILHQAYSNVEAQFDEFIKNLAMNAGTPTS
jgi:hypothetical protein